MSDPKWQPPKWQPPKLPEHVLQSLRQVAASTAPKLSEETRKRISDIVTPRPFMSDELLRAATTRITAPGLERVQDEIRGQFSLPAVDPALMQAFIDMRDVSRAEIDRSMAVLRSLEVSRLAEAARATTSRPSNDQPTETSLEVTVDGVLQSLSLKEVLDALAVAGYVFLAFAAVLLVLDRESDAAVALGAAGAVFQTIAGVTRYLRGESP